MFIFMVYEAQEPMHNFVCLYSPIQSILEREEV